MATPETLGTEDLRALVLAFRDILRAHEREINLLNVYPVRDADTGTNMALTAESVVAELASAAPGDVARAVERGAVMGGRGNSGIILSQVLAAIARAFADGTPVGAPELARALESARDAAYAAVAEPVEGTILTLAAAAARSAKAAVARGAGLGTTIAALVADCDRAVWRTRTQLEPLEAAGVVDAGALGLSLLFRALRFVVTGDDDDVVVTQPRPRDDAAETPGARYEVVFMLAAAEDAVSEMRARWRRDGESIAIAGGDGRYRCHVHTADPTAVLAAARRAGKVSGLEVVDLARQIEDARAPAQSKPPSVVVSSSLAAAATLVSELGASVGEDHRSGVACIFIGPPDADDPPDIEAPTVPHLLAALLAYDAGQSLASNVAAMRDAVAATTVAFAPDLDDLLDAVGEIPDGDVEVVTLFVEPAAVGDVASVERAVAERLPDVPLEVHAIPGLHPPFAIGAERPQSRGTEISL